MSIYPGSVCVEYLHIEQDSTVEAIGPVLHVYGPAVVDRAQLSPNACCDVSDILHTLLDADPCAPPRTDCIGRSVYLGNVPYDYWETFSLDEVMRNRILAHSRFNSSPTTLLDAWAYALRPFGNSMLHAAFFGNAVRDCRCSFPLYVRRYCLTSADHPAAELPVGFYAWEVYDELSLPDGTPGILWVSVGRAE